MAGKKNEKINFINYGFRNNSKNNEINDIIKVIKSLQNRGILLQGTATKNTSQEGRFCCLQ